MRIFVLLASVLVTLQLHAQTTQPLDDLRRLLVITYGNAAEPDRFDTRIEQFILEKPWVTSLQNAMSWSDADVASFVQMEMQSNRSLILTLRHREKYDSTMALNLVMQSFGQWVSKDVGAATQRTAAELNRIKNEVTRKMMLLQQDQQHLVADLRRSTGRMDVSEEAIQASTNAMDTALQTIAIEQEGRKARITAIQNAIAKLDAQVKERVESDPIVKELQKLVDLRSERLQVLQKNVQSGTVSKEEVSKAVEELAETRARVLLQQASSGKDAGLAQIDRFNQELLDLSIKTAEDEARAKCLRDRQIDSEDTNLKIRQLKVFGDQLTAYTANIAELEKSLNTIRVGTYGRVIIKEYNP